MVSVGRTLDYPRGRQRNRSPAGTILTYPQLWIHSPSHRVDNRVPHRPRRRRSPPSGSSRPGGCGMAGQRKNLTQIDRTEVSIWALWALVSGGSAAGPRAPALRHPWNRVGKGRPPLHLRAAVPGPASRAVVVARATHWRGG